MCSFTMRIVSITAILFSAEISAAISVTVVKDLSFGDQVVSFPATIVVGPTDSGAAVFNVSGMTPGKTATCTVSNTSITNGSGGGNNSITVSNFTINGCSSSGVVVPPSGTINGIGVGATATITAAKLQGAYTGTGTLHLGVK